MKRAATGGSPRPDYQLRCRKNAQGDIIGTLDASGNLVARYVYDSWGNCVSVYDASGKMITDGNNIGNVNPLRYRGYEYDTETGFYYYLLGFKEKVEQCESAYNSFCDSTSRR